ncbi:hypothetical protein [uncultured Mailhella sp.]|uniref:hypothetical protein n=1 Tax=uncultured Mailhella sp. TaxID=1981031 RepID=UPI002607B0F6|nr:hypothetical protein [uncultured Mailhella sp.]
MPRPIVRPSLRIVPVLLLLLTALLASGCGVRYSVSVDSLRDAEAPEVKTFVLEPGNSEVSADDLLFREVCSLVTPAFHAHGYRLADNRNEADAVAKISYWSEEPQQHVRTDYVTHAVPIARRHRHHSHIDYAYIDEPVLVAYTVYTAKLCIEASALKGRERQIWRTIYGYTGTRDDFRTMLHNIAPAIARGLGSQTNGVQYLNVEISDDGLITVTDPALGW